MGNNDEDDEDDDDNEDENGGDESFEDEEEEYEDLDENDNPVGGYKPNFRWKYLWVLFFEWRVLNLWNYFGGH